VLYKSVLSSCKLVEVDVAVGGEIDRAVLFFDCRLASSVLLLFSVSSSSCGGMDGLNRKTESSNASNTFDTTT
jgi:hypothetical protein